MKVFVAGLNHRTASLETRELLSVTREQLPQALESLRTTLGGGVILSTCNRTEVYTLAPDTGQGREAVEKFLVDCFGVPIESVSPSLYFYLQEEAIGHLFRVSAGLDSLIVGESQILGQVRDAYGAATRAEAVRGPLNRLFHEALRVGKRARRETNIGRNALSVSRACVHLAERALGRLWSCRVVVVGVGEAGRLVVRALDQRGVADIVVANRTVERARELAEEMGGRAAPFEELPRLLTEADIVVASTGSPGYVVAYGDVYDAMQRRPGRPLFMVDIAVPRDVDPRVREIEGVSLYDMDDLETVSETNRLERAQEARKVEAIIQEEVAGFMAWWDTMAVTPTIAELRLLAEEIRRREVARTLRRLRNLEPEEQESIDALSRALVQKLLHTPIAALRRRKDSSQTQVVRELFGLDPPGPS